MLPLKDRKGLHCWHLRRQETKIIILTMSSYTYTHTHPTQIHCLIIEPIIQRIRNAPLIRTFTLSKAKKITKRHDLNENRMTSIKTRAYPKCYLLGKSIWDSFNVLTVPEKSLYFQYRYYIKWKQFFIHFKRHIIANKTQAHHWINH